MYLASSLSRVVPPPSLVHLSDRYYFLLSIIPHLLLTHHIDSTVRFSLLLPLRQCPTSLTCFLFRFLLPFKVFLWLFSLSLGFPVSSSCTIVACASFALEWPVFDVYAGYCGLVCTVPAIILLPVFLDLLYFPLPIHLCVLLEYALPLTLWCTCLACRDYRPTLYMRMPMLFSVLCHMFLSPRFSSCRFVLLGTSLEQMSAICAQ